MADNWLATLGSWLVQPFRVILRPWWDRLVEQKAENAAVRMKFLEAVVRFRTKDFYQGRPYDLERAAGIAVKVIDRMAPIMREDDSMDLSSAAFLQKVEREVQLTAVPLVKWVELACLAHAGEFSHDQYLCAKFLDETTGGEAGTTLLISFVQQGIPFNQVLHLRNSGTVLSPTALGLLREYCERNALPKIEYEISASVSAIPGTLRADAGKIVPGGWKPGI